MKKLLLIVFLFCTLSLQAWERKSVWPKGKMPDQQPHQIAAMIDEASDPKFKADKHRMPYLEWYDAPAEDIRTGACVILISGGSYMNCYDVDHIRNWRKLFTEAGLQCVNFVYRTPRPEGLPIYQTAWEDAQRAVRIVRAEAKKRGYNPEKIGVCSMSAGSHLAMLLAANSQTPAYQAVDALDTVPCHINFAIAHAPAYVTTDAETGTMASRQGYGIDVRLSDVFKFDEKTCPVSLHHGGNDVFSPNGSTLIYRQLRRHKVPAELHLYPNRGHGVFGTERGLEFLRQLGILGELQPEVALDDRVTSDEGRKEKSEQKELWPAGMTPDFQENQCTPYIEWHMPKELKTRAIQIIYSGGAYYGNGPESFEVTPMRRYLNDRGMAVVTMKYRTPRPSAESGLAKHTNAWQDLQRAIRIVRSEAEARGLCPDSIGIMGSSAGGHLTLMGVTSSLQQSYNPIDDIDKLSCSVQWGIGIYPAYALTDGADGGNTEFGNEDDDILVPEFNFDLKTAPMIFIHGDADEYASMNSVKVWEKMRSMGIQSELHTLALREHCFQRTASPGTGSYNWMDRVADFLREQGIGIGE